MWLPIATDRATAAVASTVARVVRLRHVLSWKRAGMKVHAFVANADPRRVMAQYDNFGLHYDGRLRTAYGPRVCSEVGGWF